MRVFQNLFKNALEAGATTVAVTFTASGDRIDLVIKDNGAGMDADRLRRALGGGFTSKESGTGPGSEHLPPSAPRATERPSMSSRSPDQGTTVRLSFPAASSA